MKEKWLTVKEACDLTGLHPHTVRKYVRKGIIEGKKAYEAKGTPILINYLSIPTYLRK